MAEPRPGDAPAPAGGPPAPLRWLYAFGRFWQDFLIGDTPELFIGAVAVVGLVAWTLVAALRHHAAQESAARPAVEPLHG